MVKADLEIYCYITEIQTRSVKTFHAIFLTKYFYWTAKRKLYHLNLFQFHPHLPMQISLAGASIAFVIEMECAGFLAVILK